MHGAIAEGRGEGDTPRETPTEALSMTWKSHANPLPASTGPSPVSSPQGGEEVTVPSSFSAYR